MKHFVKKPIAFILTIALFCAALLPVYAQKKEDIEPYVKIYGNYYTEGSLTLKVYYRALGNAKYVDFSMKYDVDDLKFNYWGATEDFVFHSDESNPGEIIFHARPSAPHTAGGMFIIRFWVLNDQGFDLEIIPGEFVDLNGNKGTVNIVEQIVKNRIPAAQLVGLPEDLTASKLRCGDVDFDLTVTAEDARTILRAVVKLEEFTSAQAVCADINGDGDIRADDARLALREAVGL